MTWLAFAGCWLALLAFAGGIWAAAWWVYRGSKRSPPKPEPSRVDQLHAELHAREPAKVITGPWMLPSRCPDCGLEWQRPRIMTDERCEPCKAKAWHAQELADREQWEKGGDVVARGFMAGAEYKPMVCPHGKPRREVIAGKVLHDAPPCEECIKDIVKLWNPGRHML